MNSFTFAFDLLAEDHHDWRPEPYRRRRARLEELFATIPPPLQLVPSTTDLAEAV